jgi:Holliday junction resolvase
MRGNRHARELIEYLRGIGAEDVRVAPGGKHPRLVFMWRGVERNHVIAFSTGDTFRSALNTKSDIRRALGLTGGKEGRPR